MAEKFINNVPDGNLVSHIMNEPVYDMQFYIRPTTDHELISILFKCQKADKSHILDELVDKYTQFNRDTVSLTQFVKNNPWVLVALISIVVGVGTIILLITRNNKVLRSVAKERQIFADSLQEKNDQLEESVKQAQSANLAKTSFLSNMSHDIRTPMNAIIGFTNIAKKQNQQDDVGKCLDKIEESSEHLLTLINDVLDISRIESGKIIYEPYPTDITKVIDAVIAIVQGFMSGRDLNFSIERKPLETPYVITDPVRVREVLVNILGNAVKFTEDGGNITFRSDYHKADGENKIVVRYTVTDTGIGMSKEYIEKIFDEFSQENTGARTQYKGTGLGMPITKRYVEMMGGTISVESEKGVGTTDVTDEDIICDKTRINQVLLNLLSNAIKFTPSGGTVSVRVTQIHNAPEGKGLYEIRVKDTGIGISPEFAEHVFEPFERERTSTVSKIQGTGLGMAISKNIIDMMGGTIEVHSEQNKGTEFVIKLCLKLQSERRSVEKIPELSGLKALVVDDDFNTCDSVTKMLVKVGMRSEWTLSGKEAVLRARQSIEMNDAFHAYIIDWRLPDMNGIEVTRQIRAFGDDTPIIILTAYDWSDIEVEARAAGVTAFCSKPMFMSDLRESLLNALGHQKKEEEEKVLPVTEETDNFKGKRLLLVEDNELNREIASEILNEYGFIVDTAENGKIAVDTIVSSEHGYYDLVLMDIQMPVMNGYEATKSIRALEDSVLAAVPIVAMTANAFDEDRKNAADCGMNGFISKPINMEEVIEVLHSALSNK